MNYVEKKVNALLHKLAYKSLLEKNSKERLSYEINEDNKAYIIVSEDGIIEETENLNMLCWFNPDEDINRKFIGKHITELQEYLNEHTTKPESMDSFNRAVKKYVLEKEGELV